MSRLAIVTPTRGRWPHLIEQAHALAPQLGHDDLWIIGCDCSFDGDAASKIAFIIEPRQTCWLRFDYCDIGCAVDRLANSLAAFAPPDLHIVEIDDHDRIEPYALSEIRHAFDAGYDYVFGWHGQRVQIEQPDGTFAWEQWPTVKRQYTPGAFARREFDALGLRAVRRSLWDRLGGRDSRKFPLADYDMALQAEASGASIVCLQRALCCVTVEPEGSICGTLHQVPHG